MASANSYVQLLKNDSHSSDTSYPRTASTKEACCAVYDSFHRTTTPACNDRLLVLHRFEWNDAEVFPFRCIQKARAIWKKCIFLLVIYRTQEHNPIVQMQFLRKPTEKGHARKAETIIKHTFAVHSTPLHYLLYVDHNRQLQLKHHLHNLHSIVSIRKKLKLQAWCSFWNQIYWLIEIFSQAWNIKDLTSEFQKQQKPYEFVRRDRWSFERNQSVNRSLLVVLCS